MLKRLSVIIITILCLKAGATHIIGGEIIYDKLSNNNYRITLKVYRDCINGQAPFDGVDVNSAPAILTVYNGNGTLDSTYDIGAPVITIIPPTINNPCVQPPGGICVEEGVYTYTLNLPPQTGGYYLVYQRCCRNHSILNLVSPGSQGSTYYTKIPGPEEIISNNSPRFKTFPPIFICHNINFSFDHSAIDPDGDQLYYSLCPPYLGLDVNCPVIGTGCATSAPPPPYANVNYAASYSGSYPISASPAFSINPVTGLLTGKPNLLGQFVVGVCVQEFRNGTLINTHYRDFQFNVVSCIVNVSSLFADQIYKCEGSTITFTNQSISNIGGLSYQWNFGDPSTSTDTSAIVNPSYTYQDTGKYEVTLVANPGKPCTDTIKKFVYVYPPLKIEFPPNERQCLKSNAFSFTAQGMYLPQATFNWDFSAAATPSFSTIKDPSNIVYAQPGKFFVKLIAKQLTCIDSFIDTVRILPRPQALINNLPLSQCDPATVGFSNGSSSLFPMNYYWKFSNGVSSTEFQPVQVFTPPGVYAATLIVTTSSVCIDTSIISITNITVNPTPKAGFTFSPQITTIFDPEIFFVNSSSFDVNEWYYTFGDGGSSVFANEKHIYFDYGDYLVTQFVSNRFGCTDTLQQTVRILPEFRFWIPNTFTPDDNKINDVFMPVAIGVVDYEFDIFDRWGERIFSTTNPKEGWNGSYKAKECQQDVYVWRISFKNVVTSKDEIHYGHVLLLKNR